MRTDGKQTRVNFNAVFTTNHNAPFKLDPDDRRFFVAKRQTKKWQHQLSEETFLHYDRHFDEILHAELPAFCGYMMSLDTDETAANTVVMTQAKAGLIDATKTTGQIVLEALALGNLDFIDESLDDLQTHIALQILQVNAKATMTKLIHHIKETEKDGIISWAELGMIHAVINGETRQLTGQKVKKMAINMGFSEGRKRRIGEEMQTRGLLVRCTSESLTYCRNKDNV